MTIPPSFHARVFGRPGYGIPLSAAEAWPGTLQPRRDTGTEEAKVARGDPESCGSYLREVGTPVPLAGNAKPIILEDALILADASLTLRYILAKYLYRAKQCKMQITLGVKINGSSCRYSGAAQIQGPNTRKHESG